MSLNDVLNAAYEDAKKAFEEEKKKARTQQALVQQEQGIKYDANKARPDLIDDEWYERIRLDYNDDGVRDFVKSDEPGDWLLATNFVINTYPNFHHAVIDVAKVLEFGARKYTRVLTQNPVDALQELSRLCTCQNNTDQRNAIQNVDTPQKGFAFLATTNNTQKPKELHVTPIESSCVKASVESATTENSSKKIAPTPLVNEATATNGVQAIHSDSANIESAFDTRKKDKTETGDDDLLLLGLPPPTRTVSLNSKEAPAPFVESSHNAPSTSTTTTPQEKFVDSFVEDVTKVWVSWGTVLKALNVHSSICYVRAMLSVHDNSLWCSGENNWRKGFERKRLVVAALRHWDAWRGGELVAADSGLDHRAHFLCNMMFMWCLHGQEKTNGK